jgi:hypothetical protein
VLYVELGARKIGGKSAFDVIHQEMLACGAEFGVRESRPYAISPYLYAIRLYYQFLERE